VQAAEAVSKVTARPAIGMNLKDGIKDMAEAEVSIVRCGAPERR
jgi:hypothetical protein